MNSTNVVVCAKPRGVGVGQNKRLRFISTQHQWATTIVAHILTHSGNKNINHKSLPWEPSQRLVCGKYTTCRLYYSTNAYQSQG